MRIVALEEHVATPDLILAWQALPADRQDIAVGRSIVPATRQLLLDLGSRRISDYFRTNVSMTPGGILSRRYLAWAIEVLGSERILFATDYPFEEVVRGGAREFLQSAAISETDRQNIASGNWERLRAQIKRQSC